MKKLFIYSAIALSGFMLHACGEEDPEPKVEAVDPAATVEGKWLVTRLEQRTYDSNNNQIGNPKIETIYPLQSITFTSPNAFKEEQTGSNPKQATGTFSGGGNAVTLNIPTPLYIMGGAYQIDTLNANRLVMQITVPASGSSPKYNRTIRANR